MLSVGFYYLVERNMMQDTDANLLTSAEILKNSIQQKMTPIDFYFGDLKELIPKEVIVKVVDKDGTILYSNSADLKIKLVEEDIKRIFKYKSIYKNYDNVRVIIYPYKFFGRINFLVLGKDVQGQKDLINKILLIYIATMVIIIIISVSLSNILLNRILHAINRITGVAKTIKEKNLTKRIEAKYNNREIDLLIDTVNNMLDRLESDFNKVRQFTSDVSHELKTPMASIKNMIEVELTQTRDVQEYKEVMIKVLEEMDWLVKITNDLLLVTRIESGKEKLNTSFINIKELILDVVELMEIHGEEKGISIKANELADVKMECDASKIRRVILNLVSNGIKYNNPGGYVNITMTSFDGKVDIIIEDNGIGISSKNLDKIFERFYREDDVRTSKKNGTGLGLSIVDFIIKLHKGTVKVESQKDKGTKFSIELPLYQVSV